MKNANTHTTRESWLRSAAHELRPYFEKFGYVLPEKIRFALSFPSTGKRGQNEGECWHPLCSADQHYEIIIRCDIDDPLDVLGVLFAQLVRTLLPPSAKHGKEFRVIATRLGLEGKMRHATPSPLLKERLNVIADNLGQLPHGKLNYSVLANAPKKQKARMLKAECGASCGYAIRLAAKWAKAGLPVCPINTKHGTLICDMPDDKDEES